MRGEVRAIVLIASRKLYLAKCDGIATFRRSFRGALVSTENAGEVFTGQRMMATL